MKPHLPLTALLLATAACAPRMEANAPVPLAAAPTTQTAVASTPAEEDARLRAFLDEGFDAIVATSPQFMTALGIKKDYDKLNDYTDAQARRVLAMEEAQLAEMKAKFDYEALSPAGQLSYRLFEREVARDREQFEWRWHADP